MVAPGARAAGWLRACRPGQCPARESGRPDTVSLRYQHPGRGSVKHRPFADVNTEVVVDPRGIADGVEEA